LLLLIDDFAAQVDLLLVFVFFRILNCNRLSLCAGAVQMLEWFYWRMLSVECELSFEFSYSILKLFYASILLPQLVFDTVSVEIDVLRLHLHE